MIKKSLIVFIFIIFLLSPFSFNANFNFSLASTEIYGQTISSNITWDMSGSPYLIYDDVSISPAATLTIGPGVIIKLGQASIAVKGGLNVLGEEGLPVIFTSINDDARGGHSAQSSGQPAVGDWGVIKIFAGGSLFFNHAVINYGGWEYIPLVDNRNIIKPNIAYAFYNKTGVIKSTGGQVEINNSEIALNEAGIFSNAVSGQISVHNSKIYDNANGGIINYGAAPVDAINNWWGDDSGPYHETLNPQGQGNFVSDNVLFDPWIGKGVATEPEPVIIVPGIMGSYLYSYIDPGVEVWPAVGKTVIDPWDFHLNQLIMDEQGNPLPNTMIVPPQDIIRSVLNKDFFEGLINELKQNGYEENENLFVFPYDWRLDLNWTAGGVPYSGFESLKDKIEKIKLQTGAQKVNIIAHSMGGLVAKNYIKHYGSGSVDKFIDIGTPHLGAPEALKILMHGDDLGTYAINQDRIKIISQNFPSVYQLLPSQNYFNSTDPDYAYYIYDMHDLDNDGIKNKLDYAQSIDFMKNTGRNNYLLGFNDVLHSDLDNYSPVMAGIKTYNIIGCGQPTIGQIFVLNKEKSGGYEYGLKYISGDGTVPLRSAEALTADGSYYVRGAEHAVLPAANGVKQIAVAILKDTIGSFPMQDYTTISRNSADCSLTGTQISFHSPIELNVYDENNNHVGPGQNGDIELSITGAQYDNLDGNKFVFLPAGHDYRVMGQATASGSFNARVQTVQDGQYIETAYYNQVPLNSSSTVAKLEINSGQPVGAIEVDQDGDQIFETRVEPSAILNQEEATDLIKPETRISLSGDSGDNGYYISTTTVTLTATDNQGGSGILKTEYSLDNGLTWQNYNSLIVLNNSGDYSILYKSTDRAGNIEAEKAQRLKIDKTAPAINILIPLETQEFMHDELLTPEYEIADNYSGVASSSLAVLIDGQPISQEQQDLFYYSLGEHILEITVLDLAGNQAEASVKFMVSADLDSTISDVNRSYDLGWIKNKTVRSWLIEELGEIKKYEEKFGERQKKLEQRREKIIGQCLKNKNQTWCEKSLANYDKIVYKLNQTHEKIIAKRFQEILKQLEVYYKKQWLDKLAYDIIKSDINYLINNL